jgi:glycosyltransferase
MRRELKESKMRISIITAAFNREAVIGDAIRSLYAQTHREFEHVVVDGASTDNTLQIVSALSDNRTVAVSEPDQGVCDAFNKGLARASGEIVGFLHSDDFFADENVLALIANAFQQSNCDLVYGDLDYVSRSDPAKIVRHWRSGTFSQRALKFGWMPPHPTVFVTRDLLNRIGKFNCHYKISCDYDWLMKCLTEDGIKVSYIPKTLVKMRLGGVSNGSLRRIFIKSSEDFVILRRNNVGLLGSIIALVSKNIRKINQFRF